MRFRTLVPAFAMAALASAGLAVSNPFVNHAPRGAARQEATPEVAVPAPQLTTIGEMHLTQGWLWDLFGGGGGRSRESPPEDRRRPDEGWWGQGFSDRRTEMSGTFRALCVRLCDGFPVPISHATTRDRFSANAKQCEQSCPGRSRLFVVRSSAEGPDDAVDLQGQPYRKLAAAFRYRTEYDASCTCRGNPWDEEALARHRNYAEAEKAGKTKPVAAAEKPVKSQEALRREGRGGRPSRTARSDWQRGDDD